MMCAFRKALAICCATLMLLSCEKPVIAEEEPAEAEGNLTVRVYQIEHTPFAEFSRASLSDACSRLNYAIYNSNGVRVKQVNQTASESQFGAASFDLDPGVYQLVVVGHSSNGNPAMTNLAKIQFTNSQGFTDTFLYYSDAVVVTEDHQDLPVSLGRIVALCKFTITDDIPEKVARLRFYYEGGSGAVDATTGYGSVNSKQILFFDVAEGQKEFDLYTFLHDEEGTIRLKLTAYDTDDNVLLERDFEIPMQQKLITWFSGP